MARFTEVLLEDAEPADYRDELGVPIPAAHGQFDPDKEERVLRLSAMAFAVEMSGQRGMPMNVVEQAEKILAFLKGGDPK